MGVENVNDMRLAAHVMKQLGAEHDNLIDEMCDLAVAFSETPEGKIFLQSTQRIIATNTSEMAFLHAFALGYMLRAVETEMVASVSAGDATCIEHHRRNCPGCCGKQTKVTLHPTD